MTNIGFNAAEKHQSQIPALQILVALGFQPLSQAEALRLRGGRSRNVVLDDVLAEKLLEINHFTHGGRDYPFDLEDAHEAIRRLKPTPDRIKGLRATNQEIYDTLILGTTITKTIDGDSKSYSFRYVDWETPGNNAFHVTAEFPVERTGSTQTKRCDIVAFVNGIPFVVIGNKRPTESLKKADSQLIGYQFEANIPQLFHFSQLLMSMNRLGARYAAIGASRQYWQAWKDEEDRDEDITAAANRSLTAPEATAIFSGDFADARQYFDDLATEGARAVTAQDRTIFALCRPERLLDLVRRFTVFDGGTRKVARHQQFFGIRRATQRVRQVDIQGRRKGGVIWHTQGSGKSLTMVMLGRALALDRVIRNPRIIIVTDRDDLDKQIRDTYKSCDLEPARATSGAHLLDLIRDKAPLVEQQVNGDVIDRWFDKISEGLTDSQKADLKRKFSRMDALSKTNQAIRAKAFDISEHFRQHWQDTGFKAQLVAPSKAAAVRFKEVLDEIGHVSSAIMISPPDDNEGNEEVDKESRDIVRAFWAQMMKRYKNESEYNRHIIDTFKGPGEPEILIVVSKLLTGFDAPRNTVLYVCKPLREHNLLQAIARVNRLFEDGTTEKEFGFIVDYEGLLGELDAALTTYSAFEGFDTADLAGTVHDIHEEIRKLPHLHDQLWDLFKPVRNKKDMEQFEQFLANDAVRQDFYTRLKVFSRCLHISLSSDKLLDVFKEEKVDRMKRDWKQFSELKRAVQLRYQEIVDVKEFEPKIQKLLDDHVVALPAEVIIEMVNINNADALKAVVDETGVSEASKADRIASATRRVITEKMDEDPAFYRQFSELLEETIRDYRERRISERDYLNNVIDLASKISRKDRGRDVPEPVKDNEDGQAFFAILEGALVKLGGEPVPSNDTARIALSLIEIIKDHHIVDVWSNETAQNKMRNAIDDFFFDVLRDEQGIELSMEVLDDLELRFMDLARARFPG